MRERKYVKFKLDIYDDTKTKIIDQKPERDFIHYFFARSIILAGKSDCEGELYMGKDIPYTIESLATEFGRDTALIKVALDVLIELKMIEVTEDNIYRVKSFVKHQNIKVKKENDIGHDEKVKIKEEVKANEVAQKANTVKGKDRKAVRTEDKDAIKEMVNEERKEDNNLETAQNAANIIGIEMKNNISSGSFEVVSEPILLKEEKSYRNANNKNKSKNKETEISVTEEREDDECLFSFHDGDFVLREGETIVRQFTVN